MRNKTDFAVLILIIGICVWCAVPMINLPDDGEIIVTDDEKLEAAQDALMFMRHRDEIGTIRHDGWRITRHEDGREVIQIGDKLIEN